MPRHDRQVSWRGIGFAGKHHVAIIRRPTSRYGFFR